ncbi:hypothetical protein [Streptomyces sp. NPDC058401]|uniref:hypothetical protein n=1 Tax=Streptomyces sp. NPDC058401 TaxID=3346480 RepID=UPI0036556E5B
MRRRRMEALACHAPLALECGETLAQGEEDVSVADLEELARRVPGEAGRGRHAHVQAHQTGDVPASAQGGGHRRDRVRAGQLRTTPFA